MGPGMILLIVGAIALGAALFVTIAVLTLPKLKEFIKKRKEKKERQKVAFGDTRKIINENAEEILQKAPKLSMDELEDICEENPYFVVDVDKNKENASNFTYIKTDKTDEGVEELIDNKGGVVVFE